MAHDKYEIASVLRENLGHCFLYIEKPSSSSATHSCPSPEAARGTEWQRVTSVIEDVSIRINMFGMGSHVPSGRDLERFLLGEVERAFAHRNIHTYAMVADMSCFGVEAKEELQAHRLKSARAQAERYGIKPYAWDIDNPTPIVDLNRPLPALIALQSTPGAVRQMLFEAMSLLASTYQPPNGKRLILHMEPRHHTNPGCIEDFMPTDPSSGIVLCTDRMQEIEAARAEMTELAKTATPAQFRAAARQKTTDLARAGCFFTVPICLETSVNGIPCQPFRLLRMRNQAGEADLSIQRYVTYLHTGAITMRLGGTRQTLHSAHSSFYTREQATNSAIAESHRPDEIYIGEGGADRVQCSAVVSTDSDFMMLLVYTMAQLIAHHDSKRKEGEPTGYENYAPHAPLLVRGAVRTKSRETLLPGERRTYCSANSEEPGLLTSQELFNPALAYDAIVRGSVATRSPLASIVADAEYRTKKAATKRAVTLAAKRALTDNGAEQPAAKKSSSTSSTAAAAKSVATEPAANDENADDQDNDLVIPLAPPPPNATVDAKFERVASFVCMTAMLGNDYLAGIPGVARRWAFAAYAELLHRQPDVSLVRALRHDGADEIEPSEPGSSASVRAVRAPTPTLPLVIDVAAHEKFLLYAYYMNLMAQACKTNKPTIALDKLSLTEVAQAVVQKYKKDEGKHVPEASIRERMQIRLLWWLAYVTRGSTSIRNILDPLEFGWDGKWRKIIV